MAPRDLAAASLRSILAGTMPAARPSIGQKLSWTRTFTEEDVRAFAALSHDEGRHHVERDARGRLMVHGLLTATLPTKIGGDLDYIAHTMGFEFLRPVFVGDTIACEVTITRLDERNGRLEMAGEVVCTNQDGKVVLRASTSGIIRS
jgi:acyl dehydratase